MTISTPSLAWIFDFREGRVAPEALRHPDHVRLAWAYLQTFGPAGALASFPEDLDRFATAAGAPGKFHAALTEAWLHLVQARMDLLPGAAWEEFAAANGDLFIGDPFAKVGFSR